MKKYLMMGAAALLMGASFTSCSKDKDLYDPQANAMKFLQDYQAAFISVFGTPAANQTWGFGTAAQARMTRSGNTSGDYNPWPATHEYTDAYGNVVAGANMNSNQWGSTDLQSMPFGGWIVPDPLTERQKLRVKLYFQNNDKLSYEDPHYANFYVQQVYTGGTSAPTTGNHESTIGADGQGHAGMTLNQLTVGQAVKADGTASSHINNFNAGTGTERDVLNHEGKTQRDRITLMVNVDDTSCFGYHETSGSNVQASTNHNDKMALVSAATIDAWAKSDAAKALGVDLGDPVVDDWNRSFMGFDYELLPECDIIQDSYALLSQVPNINNMQYAWDGQKVMTIGAAPEASEPQKLYDDYELFPNNGNNFFTLNGTSCQGQATCSEVDGKIACYFPAWTSITFSQGSQKWDQWSELVIEFEKSPINGHIQCGSERLDFAIDDTRLVVPLHDNQWNGDGPVISTDDGTSGTLNITKVTLIGKSSEGYTPDPNIVYYNPTYLLGDGDADKIAFYSRNTNMYGGIVRELTENEMKTSEGYLDLTLFQGLKRDGYHPITTDLKTWVKWQAACDGYYSDWIVTLTKAERIDGTTPPEPDPENPGLRVICEDLTVSEAGDFDFNDLVFDAEYVSANEVKVTLQAAGGTLPLYINGQEVHQLFSIANPGATTDQGGQIDVKTMINTHADGYVGTKYSSAELPNKPVLTFRDDILPSGTTWSDDANTFATQVRDYIVITVTKTDDSGVSSNITLTAEKGKTPGKVGVGTSYNWKNERQYIGDNFKKFVKDPSFAMWWKE